MSGHAPAPCDVQFMVHGRSNDGLDHHTNPGVQRLLATDSAIRTAASPSPSLRSAANAPFGSLATVPTQGSFAHGLREASHGSTCLLRSSGLQQALRLSLGDIVHRRRLCFCHTYTPSHGRRTRALTRLRRQVFVLRRAGLGYPIHEGDRDMPTRPRRMQIAIPAPWPWCQEHLTRSHKQARQGGRTP